MQNLPVLFLLVLLASCSPAVTEVPGPTDAPITTNTPAPTATATLPPSPTPTESPEEAAARLVQDVLDGTLADLSSLDEQLRLAVIEILTEHIPELAGMVIQNQDRYAEFVLPFHENLQRAIHLEIAAQINANKEISHTHTNARGVKMVYDAEKKRWVPTALPDGYEDQMTLPENIQAAGEQPAQVWRAARSIVNPTTGEITGHERYDYQTQEWVPLDLIGMMLPHLTGDLRADNPLLKQYHEVFGAAKTDEYLSYFPQKDTGMVISCIVSNNFTDSLPVPTSHSVMVTSTKEWWFYDFPSMEVECPMINAQTGRLLGLLVLHPFIDFSMGTEMQVVDQSFNPVGKISRLKPSGMGGELRLPQWNTNQANSAVGQRLTFIAIPPEMLSLYSGNRLRGDEVFPSEMMTLQEFLRICPEGQCDLKALQETNKSWLAFGMISPAIVKDK
jgi:hypothetical protein